MRKKIRVKIPKLVYDVLIQDMKYLGLKRETLYNIILQELGFEKIHEIGKELLSLDEKKQIAFNLNDMNTSLILAIQETQKISNDSELIIKLFSTYANLHSAIRESIIRKDFFLRLEKAIKEKNEVKILYQNIVIKILPLAFERNSKTGYNYLQVKNGNEEFLYEVRKIKFIS